MSWTFKETNNKHLFAKAFEWYLQMPGFIKKVCRYTDDDKEEFIDALSQSRCFSGYKDGEFVALVVSQGRDIIQEGHLYSKRGVSPAFLTGLASYALSRLTGPVLLEISSKQKSLHKIVEQAGFKYTGLNKWKGVYRSRPLESSFFIHGT